MLVKAFEPVNIDKGKTIVQQGSLDEHLYVVEKGTIEFRVSNDNNNDDNGKININDNDHDNDNDNNSSNDDENKGSEEKSNDDNQTQIAATTATVVVATGGAGTTFGDQNLLHALPAERTVVATESTKVFRLHQETYRGILQQGHVVEEAKKKRLQREKQKQQEKEKQEQQENGKPIHEETEPPSEEEKQEDAEEEEWWKDSKTAQLQLAIRNALEKVHQDDLERIKVLGEGQFGEVWLVAADLQLQLDNNNNDGDESKSESNIHEERFEFALKLQETWDEFRYETATSELNIMKEVSVSGHPFVSMLYRSYETEESKDMLLGLIPGGELWDTIHKENEDTGEWLSGLTEGASRFYAMVVADTLDYLHSRHYVFRDLKPENIMLDGYGYPVVVDFGFCKCLPKGPDEKTFTFCGTPNYVAPEIIMNVGHNSKVDCWALGIVIYEMITGINPFFYDDMDNVELYRSICEDEGEPLSEKNHSRQVRRLIEGLLAKDPSKRMAARDILGHSWFEGLSLKRLRKRQIKAPWIPPGGEGETAEYCSDSDQEAAVAARKREQEVEAEILRRKQEEEERFRQQQLEKEEEARRLEEERLRFEEEERLRQEEELRIQQELEERRKREEEEERRREEEERLRKEEELRLQRELEERQRIEKEEEEERRRLEEELRIEKEEEEKRRREEELRLQRQQEEEEKRRREEELRLQKELEEQERLEEEEEERRRKERLKRQEEELLRLEEQKRIEKEEEELSVSPVDSDFEDDEGDLPLRNGTGNSSRRWEYRQSPKRSSRRSIEELTSPVPKGIVSKLINDSSNNNKSPYSRGPQSMSPGALDSQRSVRRGLVAKRLSAAKEKEEPGNIPSLFASFSLLEK